MTFNQGKFYVDGKEVPLEFGNKDQIKLIDKVKAMKYGVLALTHFTCVCGEGFNIPEMEVGKFQCKECKNIYRLSEDEDTGLPIVTLQ